MNDVGYGKSKGIRHGQIHYLRSDYSINCIHNLGNPSRIRPDNEYIVEIQVNISSDTTLGEEAIGQHVKTNGKPKGISHLKRMSIIVDPTPVPQIYSRVKRKGDSS